MAMQAVKDLVAKNLVMVFSKSTCPFCMRAKATIKEHGHDFHAVELDQLAEGKEMQASLLELTGQRTVPNVFIKGKHLGGCDDTLAALDSGKFKEMMQG
jgi:glutaredoxin|mmetsp:Transcript_59672/g.98985  ORF Transcript_59672/g.98985 Transcript_59672/m.98985 type:complete len:99 (+) Transcript_59672:50-346(+)|eukprot:CAMPEP_0174291908 /NCGR_PEP_ID=MMETSP0809-20121228/33667_1 /TAXON_ID=73025 ORGANISM="Eutreptiella gymnastica-like, Strain CCMP1594" /NCGR_SAMPLE_ID=MMETSP0809 /ASSEMBLY_ACC=CAM_ASM_000658 /LENGTH=98 /DNA_ID=CAMNT_0015391607 /DNA_START=44 /DNA_END=340 /DNA_ORIENTATION=-